MTSVYVIPAIVVKMSAKKLNWDVESVSINSSFELSNSFDGVVDYTEKDISTTIEIIVSHQGKKQKLTGELVNWKVEDMKCIDTFDGPHRFLSNFWPCSIVYDGVEYPSVEHAYQAAKTTDIEKRLAISKLATAAAAKKAGRNVALREDWEQVKLAVMTELVSLKFIYPDLLQQLLDTDNAELIEGNWWGDTYWGVCDGKGENHLGKILMKIRDERNYCNAV